MELQRALDAAHVLREWNTLKEEGIITDDEWRAMKAKLVSSAVHHSEPIGDAALDAEHVDAEDKFGRTPLWTAAMAGCHDAAAALLARGARKDFPAFSGRTPQEIADMYGHYDLGKFIANYVKPATPRPPEPSPAPAPAPAATERPRSAGEAVVSAKPSLGLPELDVARAKAGVRVFEALPAP